MAITMSLDMQIPNATGGWTLADAVENLKRAGMTRLLNGGLEEISELLYGFERALRDGQTPTAGEVWAAYYEVVTQELEAAYWERDEISTATYAARKGALTRLVIRKP